MIVCTKCGYQNDPSDSFCGSCGSFLEWTGAKVEPAAEVVGPEPTAPEPAREREQPGLIDRVRDVVGLGGRGGEPPAEIADIAGAVDLSSDAGPAAAEPAAPGGWAADAVAPAPPRAPVVVSGPRVFRVSDGADMQGAAGAASEPAAAAGDVPVQPVAAEIEPASAEQAPAEIEPTLPEQAPAEPEVKPSVDPTLAVEAATANETVLIVRAPDADIVAVALPAGGEPGPGSMVDLPAGDILTAESPPLAIVDVAVEGQEATAGAQEPTADAPPAVGELSSDEALPAVHEVAGDPDGAVAAAAPPATAAASAETMASHETPAPSAAPMPFVDAAPEPAAPAPAAPPPAHEPAAPPPAPAPATLSPTLPPAAAPTAAPSPAPEATGPTCRACGRMNPVGRVFCVSCGERLPSATTSREEPRIRPMLPGAPVTSKPRSLVHPARPADLPPVLTPPLGSPTATAPIPSAATTPAPPGVATPVVPVAASVPQAPVAPLLATAAPVQPAAQRPGPTQPPARLPAAPAPAAPPAPRSAPPPTRDEQPAARRPEAVKPGPEHPRPTGRAVDTPAPNPGDLVCGNCGIGNDPARRFCRRCGQSLATATIAPTPKLPWYRRILGRSARRPAAAGERPKSMRTDGRTGGGVRWGHVLTVVLQMVVIAGVVGGIAGVALVPGFRDTVTGWLTSVKEMVIPSADPVNTSGTATGPAVKDHPAQLAFDGTTRFWAAPFTSDQPLTIRAAFSPAADISKVLFTAGAPGDQFKSFARPRDVTLELLDPAGIVLASKTYELKDQADLQAFDVGAKGVAGVRLTIRSVFAAEVANAPVAILEVEFRGKREAASPSP